MSDQANDTTVSKVEMTADDINQLLGMPTGDNVLTPEEKKPNLFSNSKVDTSFIDNEEEEEEETSELGEDGKPKVIPLSNLDVNAILDIDKNPLEVEPIKASKKIDKNGLVDITNKLFEKKILTPFDDDKKVEEYTMNDFEELFEANFKEKERELRDTLPGEFFEALPQELQIAAKYYADGGRNMKQLFQTLSRVEETRELDPDNEEHQEIIARQFLSTNDFGTEDEIEDEIRSYKDMNKLGQKAKQFKPKLDRMQEEIVTRQLATQEHNKKKQVAAANKFMEDVYSVLEGSELNGIKLDKKTQGMLYSGMVQTNYPSITGRQTNLLGHLLEKFQFVEPDLPRVAEALYLLADPEGFKEKIRAVGSKAEVVKTVRMLKQEQSNKLQTSTQEEPEQKENKKTLMRPSSNFFKR